MTKDELQRAVDALRPWHYCHIFPYGISTGDSAVPVQSEKLTLLLQAGAFPEASYPKVLDIGSNSGLISMWFVDNKQSEVLAMENDERFYPQLELAIEAKGYTGKVTPLRYDVTKGNYGTELYDLVLFLGVMHHLHPITHNVVFESAYAALKPGGAMVVQTIGTLLVLKHLKAAGFKARKLEGYSQGDRLAWIGVKNAGSSSKGSKAG